MTDIEYINSECENKYCKFTLIDGIVEYGVVTTVFPNEPQQYYLVRANQMIEFKKYMDKSDYTKMKELCSPISLESIVEVDRIEKISFRPKAKIAFQGLSKQAQGKANDLIMQASNNIDFLKRQSQVKILGKSIFVLRLGEQVRILIQKEDYGIIVIDIIFHR